MSHFNAIKSGRCSVSILEIQASNLFVLDQFRNIESYATIFAIMEAEMAKMGKKWYPISIIIRLLLGHRNG